jgi:hypothetical protein
MFRSIPPLVRSLVKVNRPTLSKAFVIRLTFWR